MFTELPDPNKIKLITSDLDGTLLNPKGEISEGTSNIIKKILEQYPKLHFVIASGREMPSTKHVREALDIINRPKTESLLLNGSIVYDSNGDIIWQSILPSEFIIKFNNIMDSYSVTTFIYSCGENSVLSDEEFEKEARILFKKKTVLVNNKEFIQKVASNEIDVNKISLLVRNIPRDIVEEMKIKIEEIIKEYNLEYAYSSDIFFEYTPHQTNKGTGLAQLLKNLNISKDEVIAFGDGGNDLEFFENAGWPIAMGNCCEELKPYARLITKTNAEDGVAYILEKIFLKN